jgi:hypothetical protein
MPHWKQATLSHNTLVGTHRIVRIPGVSDEACQRHLQEQVLAAAPIPGLNRVTNVIAQELRREEREDGVDAYLWDIVWNGLHDADRVQSGCEEMYAAVREQLEQVGVRVSLSVASIESRWESE